MAELKNKLVESLEPHQQRIVTESDELSERLNKLNAFLMAEKFKELPAIEQQLLKRQQQAMVEYSMALFARVSLFVDLK